MDVHTIYLLIIFVGATGSLLLMSYLSNHYDSIISRQRQTIQEQLELIAKLSNHDDDDEDWELSPRATTLSPYTIQYPLDDRPWPKKDGPDDK